MRYECGVRACQESLAAGDFSAVPSAHLEEITAGPRLSASGQARKLPGNELPHDLLESAGAGLGRTPFFRPKGQVGGAGEIVRAAGRDPATGMWCSELPPARSGRGTERAPPDGRRRTGGGRREGGRGTLGERFRADPAPRSAAPGRPRSPRGRTPPRAAGAGPWPFVREPTSDEFAEFAEAHGQTVKTRSRRSVVVAAAGIRSSAVPAWAGTVPGGATVRTAAAAGTAQGGGEDGGGDRAEQGGGEDGGRGECRCRRTARGTEGSGKRHRTMSPGPGRAATQRCAARRGGRVRPCCSAPRTRPRTARRRRCRRAA